jgi:hypothetical protein
VWYRIAWQFGCSVAELQGRMSSAEFVRWCAFLRMEPDTGTRMDVLASAVGALIGRVEGTMGGKPPRLRGRLVEWDRDEEADQNALVEWIKSIGTKPNG